MKILGIKHNPSYNIRQNISFKAKSEDIYDRARRIELTDEANEENFNDAYNTECEPIEYERTFTSYVRPMILPSERYKKHKSTLRDEELFYDDYDILHFYGPGKYDPEDVPLREELWMKAYRSDDNVYNTTDTDIAREDIQFVEAIYSPWITKNSRNDKDKLNKYLDGVMSQLIQEEHIDYRTIKDMFKSSTLLKNGETNIHPTLCNLAIRVLLNSRQWGDTEKAIMDEVRIPIYKKVYGNYSLKKCKVVNACIRSDYTNEETLEYLKEHYPGYILNLGSIMTPEDEIAFNKNQS